MRKLTPDEEHALAVLEKHGSYCPHDGMGDDVRYLRSLMDSLVRKKRAWVEATDAGPRFHPYGLGLHG